MKAFMNKKGQGMMEYIVIAAFAVGLAIFLYKQVKGPAQKNITDIATGMTDASSNR